MQQGQLQSALVEYLLICFTSSHLHMVFISNILLHSPLFHIYAFLIRNILLSHHHMKQVYHEEYYFFSALLIISLHFYSCFFCSLLHFLHYPIRHVRLAVRCSACCLVRCLVRCLICRPVQVYHIFSKIRQLH